jgi:hypothetical protein
MRKIFSVLILTGWFLAAGPVHDSGAGIVIKVRALNPLETEETAKIRYPLPVEIKEADILGQKVTFSLEHAEEEKPRKTQLKFSADEKTGGVYVDDEVLLSAKEVMTLEVDVRDVWVVAPEEIDGLRQEATALLEKWGRRETVLDGDGQPAGDPGEAREGAGEPEAEDEKAVALELKDEIFSQLDAVVERQERCAVIKAGVERHISGYKENIEALRQVRQDMEMLARLLGLDGEDKADQPVEAGEDAPEAPDVQETGDPRDTRENLERPEERGAGQ